MSEERNNSLAVLQNATRLLAQVKDSRDAKKLMDMAGAAEHYAKKAKLGQEAIDHAHSIKIEAQSILGKFLKNAPRNEGGRPTKTSSNIEQVIPTIDDLGLTRKESSNSQLLADIANKDPKEFEAIKKGEKSISEVRRELKRAEVVKNIKELPSEKYRVIYADPPWSYNDKCDDGSVQSGGAEKHYPSMTITELCLLPINELSDRNAVLFLWTTSPLLFECEPVFKSWGFEYKASFVWDKVSHNMGHYNSVRHEFLLICTKGSCLPDVNKLFDSVQSIEKTRRHSEKPDEFRKIIDTLYPHGKRIELFARTKKDGWDAWGAESE